MGLSWGVAPDTLPNAQSGSRTSEPAFSPSLIATDTVTMATLNCKSKHSSPVLLKTEEGWEVYFTMSRLR
ncbi:uncharacterized [Tachysurus ichikawai]